MDKNDNIKLIESFFSFFSKGDITGIESVLAEDIRWIIPGHHPLAGVKVGIPEVLSYFEQLAKSGFKAEPKFLEANDQYVVDFHRVFNTHGEARLDGTSILVWKIENDKIAEVQNYPGDQHAWDDFFWKTYALKPLPDRLAETASA
jgi:ketosteroid isomerase-like protein